MSDSYMPLKTGEATQMQLLHGFLQILVDAQEPLEKRLKRCGRWRQYRVVQAWMGRIVNDLMNTIEPRKRNLFLVNLWNQEIRVVNKGGVSAMPYMTVCREDDLLWLIKDEIRENCAVCMGHGPDMRKCELRRHLKNMTLFDLDESGGVCMGKQIDTREE